jgi:hypothetical protein
MYTIEIPASGGASINNDTEGFGWFTGFATGILPWRGPVIGFRASALNNSLIDGTTIDVNVTAMAANVVTATAIATAAIDADAIATDAIGAAEFAADAIAEIADSIWDEALSGHVAAGSFGRAGQIIRDGTAQAGGSNTITLDAGASAVDEFYTGLLIHLIGGTGAGGVRMIFEYNGTTKVATISPVWETDPNGTTTFVIRPVGPAEVDMWRRDIPFNLVSGDVPVIVDVMGANTVTAAAIADAAIDNATFAADVGSTAIGTNVIGIAAKKGVVDAINVDTYAEPGQEAPPATTTLVKKIGYLYKAFRNRITQTSTTLKLFADDATTVDQKATVSDDATTYDRGEIATGP